jgi:hypothetical protein
MDSMMAIQWKEKMALKKKEKWFKDLFKAHYKKTWLFKRSNLIEMFTLTKGDGHFN